MLVGAPPSRGSCPEPGHRTVGRSASGMGGNGKLHSVEGIVLGRGGLAVDVQQGVRETFRRHP